MPPKRAKWKSAGTPGVETRAARATRLATDAADAVDAANNAPQVAANSTISPITASPAGSPPPRSPSTPPSTGRTLPSTTSSTDPTGSPHGSLPGSSLPCAPSTPPSIGRTPPSPIFSMSSYSQPCCPPNPPPETLGRPGFYRGGPSDTPSVSIFGEWGRVQREHPNQSVSRQLYIYQALTGIRNRFNWLTSLLILIPWRFGIYPWRMYFRQAYFMWLGLATLSISYMYLNWLWLSGMYKDERRALILPVWYTYIYITWLYLHLFDLYRAIEYLVCNPQDVFPGWWTDRSIRLCAIMRPVTRIVIAVSVFLACLEDNMTRAEWHAVVAKMFIETFTLGLVCGIVEIAVYWFVGFFAQRRRMAYTMGGAEIGLFERWEVEAVMPWSTAVAVFFALKFVGVYINIAWARGWLFIPGGNGVPWVGGWVSELRFWVPTQKILPPSGTGFVVRA